MKLKYKSAPVAGQTFSVTALDFKGSVGILITVGGVVVAKKECPDPPCHEMLKIAQDAGGKGLQVIARDSDGNEEKLDLPIMKAQTL